MPEYRYVVVSSDGRSWLLQGDEQYDKNADHNQVLPQLLKDGWKPVRERALAGQDGAFALVLLKRWPQGDEDIPF
jgi:hypothetical protein